MGGEGAAGRTNAIHAGGHSGIDGDLEQDLDDGLPADPHIEGGPDMELELSGRRAHSHQGRHREHLAGAEIDAGTGEHIGKGKPQHQLGKLR